MRRLVLCLTALSSILLAQSPAAAGGWWTTLDLHGDYLGTGESLTVKASEVLFDSIEEAERAERTPYFAYLTQNFDRRLLDRAMTRGNPDKWWRPFGPAIKIGDVTLLGSDTNLFRARVHLEIPDIAPGRYFLMLCDEGCQRPLGNHVPISVNVTSDPLAAQTARRLDNTNQRIRIALSGMRRDFNNTERRLERAELEITRAQDAVDAVPQAPPTQPSETDPTPWIAYAGWFLAGTLAAFVVAQRISKTKLPDVIVEPAPDDARELTTSR